MRRAVRRFPILLLPLLAFAPAAAHATDVTGLWELSTQINQTPVVIHCSVLQIGADLSGWCRPESAGMDPSAFTGRLDGQTLTWGYDVTFRGSRNHVAYSATLSSASAMTGTLTGTGAPAAFTAARK